jgi:ribosomal protein S18 acetylase RimI-like enzyme
MAASDSSSELLSSARAAAEAFLGRKRSGEPLPSLGSSLDSPERLGIRTSSRVWLQDCMVWGMAFRSWMDCPDASDRTPGLFPMAGGLVFRLAHTLEDFSVVHHYVRALATFEGEPESVSLSPEGFMRDGVGDSPEITVIIASAPVEGFSSEIPSVLTANAPKGFVDVGLAMWTTAYSSWKGRSLYLEDLFIDPCMRQQGIGSALIRVGAAAAEASRCERMAWIVLNWNEGAIRCYTRMGTVPLSEWTVHRLHDENLSCCALGEPPAVA